MVFSMLWTLPPVNPSGSARPTLQSVLLLLLRMVLSLPLTMVVTSISYTN
jgi:hypothetical protein